MIKSEMQHQFWITKKTVQRKLGSKEDSCITQSDAELDAKIEVFKSIAETSTDLCRIIEQMQERVCILSQEESCFGRFLKEAGKRSKTTGQSITNTGKSVSYCGQQRMCVRVPLLRLQHEVDIFRNRAVIDTQNTITGMEKERTEYRAALNWMKSSSAELDPDSGRGVDKFRTAQNAVRSAKQNFDSLSMDSIQKIDLLAAARCNMFSHVLVSYMTELKQFAQKTNATYETISKALNQRPKYDFCVLKELTQHEEVQEEVDNTNIAAFDNDQSLFFASEYADAKEEKSTADVMQPAVVDKISEDPLIEIPQNDAMDLYIGDNLDILNALDGQSEENESSNLLAKMFGSNMLSSKLSNTNKIQSQPTMINKAGSENVRNIPPSNLLKNDKTSSTKKSKQNPWIELFADLDPFANLEAFDMKLSGGNKTSQQT